MKFELIEVRNPNTPSTRIASFGGGKLMCLQCRHDFECPTVLVSPKPKPTPPPALPARVVTETKPDPLACLFN
jgi:hypothetical protein